MFLRLHVDHPPTFICWYSCPHVNEPPAPLPPGSPTSTEPRSVHYSSTQAKWSDQWRWAIETAVQFHKPNGIMTRVRDIFTRQSHLREHLAQGMQSFKARHHNNDHGLRMSGHGMMKPVEEGREPERDFASQCGRQKDSIREKDTNEVRQRERERQQELELESQRALKIVQARPPSGGHHRGHHVSRSKGQQHRPQTKTQGGSLRKQLDAQKATAGK